MVQKSLVIQGEKGDIVTCCGGDLKLYLPILYTNFLPRGSVNLNSGIFGIKSFDSSESYHEFSLHEWAIN